MRLWEWACVSVVLGLELLPCFLGTRVFVWLALSPCLRVDGLSVCGCPFGSGFVRVGLSLFLRPLPPAAWLSALSHLCSSLRLGFLLAETVS